MSRTWHGRNTRNQTKGKFIKEDNSNQRELLNQNKDPICQLLKTINKTLSMIKNQQQQQMYIPSPDKKNHNEQGGSPQDGDKCLKSPAMNKQMVDSNNIMAASANAQRRRLNKTPEPVVDIRLPSQRFLKAVPSQQQAPFFQKAAIDIKKMISTREPQVLKDKNIDYTNDLEWIYHVRTKVQEEDSATATANIPTTAATRDNQCKEQMLNEEFTLNQAQKDDDDLALKEVRSVTIVGKYLLFRMPLQQGKRDSLKKNTPMFVIQSVGKPVLQQSIFNQSEEVAMPYLEKLGSHTNNGSSILKKSFRCQLGIPQSSHGGNGTAGARSNVCNPNTGDPLNSGVVQGQSNSPSPKPLSFYQQNDQGFSAEQKNIASDHHRNEKNLLFQANCESNPRFETSNQAVSIQAIQSYTYKWLDLNMWEVRYEFDPQMQPIKFKKSLFGINKQQQQPQSAMATSAKNPAAGLQIIPYDLPNAKNANANQKNEVNQITPGATVFDSPIVVESLSPQKQSNLMQSHFYTGNCNEENKMDFSLKADGGMENSIEEVLSFKNKCGKSQIEPQLKQQTVQQEFPWKIKLRPFSFDEKWDHWIEITFRHQRDFSQLKSQLKNYCLVAGPTLEQEYQYVDLLGAGSQAKVELYRQKIQQSSSKFAVSSQQVILQSRASNISLQKGNALQAIGGQLQQAINSFKNNQTSQQQVKGGVKPQQPLGEQFAVKTFTINNPQIQSETQVILNEITFLRELKQCENVAQLINVYTTFEKKTGKKQIMLILQFAKYGTLLRYLHQVNEGLSESKTRIILAQMLLAIDLMHRKGIIHRDIKPDNILLLDKRSLKISISDLGLACRANDRALTKVRCGTPGYCDPDVLNGEPFTTKSDIFSIGSLFYNCLTSSSLFKGITAKEVLAANKTSTPLTLINETAGLSNMISEDCLDLLRLMVQPEPKLRPSAETCLMHPWFRKDREAIENSLFINKNQLLVTNMFVLEKYQYAFITRSINRRERALNRNQSEDQVVYMPSLSSLKGSDDDFVSFIFSPNYYEKANMYFQVTNASQFEVLSQYQLPSFQTNNNQKEQSKQQVACITSSLFHKSHCNQNLSKGRVGCGSTNQLQNGPPEVAASGNASSGKYLQKQSSWLSQVNFNQLINGKNPRPRADSEGMDLTGLKALVQTIDGHLQHITAQNSQVKDVPASPCEKANGSFLQLLPENLRPRQNSVQQVNSNLGVRDAQLSISRNASGFTFHDLGLQQLAKKVIYKSTLNCCQAPPVKFCYNKIISHGRERQMQNRYLTKSIHQFAILNNQQSQMSMAPMTPLQNRQQQQLMETVNLFTNSNNANNTIRQAPLEMLRESMRQPINQSMHKNGGDPAQKSIACEVNKTVTLYSPISGGGRVPLNQNQESQGRQSPNANPPVAYVLNTPQQVRIRKISCQEENSSRSKLFIATGVENSKISKMILEAKIRENSGSPPVLNNQEGLQNAQPQRNQTEEQKNALNYLLERRRQGTNRQEGGGLGTVTVPYNEPLLKEKGDAGSAATPANEGTDKRVTTIQVAAQGAAAAGVNKRHITEQVCVSSVMGIIIDEERKMNKSRQQQLCEEVKRSCNLDPFNCTDQSVAQEDTDCQEEELREYSRKISLSDNLFNSNRVKNPRNVEC